MTKYLGLILALFAFPAFAQTVNLSVTPASGDGKVTPVATWSATGVTTCTASGGWSGTKAISGTETLPAITKDTTYNLTCTSPAGTTGSVQFTWVPPVARTDGSPLTDLAKTRIYHGTATGTYTASIDVPGATTSSFIAGGLPVGACFFAATAIDAAGNESLKSNEVRVVVVGAPGVTVSATPVTVTVKSLPNPPGSLTGVAVAPVADANVSPVLRLRPDGTVRFSVAGFVPVGTSCTGDVVTVYRGMEYRYVDVAAVKWWNVAPSRRAIAACEPV